MSDLNENNVEMRWPDSSAARRIRQKIAQLRGVQRKPMNALATLPQIRCESLNVTSGLIMIMRPYSCFLSGRRPRALDASAYTGGMQNTISPVYGAPPSVTAGAVQAMQQADLIHQVGR